MLAAQPWSKRPQPQRPVQPAPGLQARSGPSPASSRPPGLASPPLRQLSPEQPPQTPRPEERLGQGLSRNQKTPWWHWSQQKLDTRFHNGFRHVCLTTDHPGGQRPCLSLFTAHPQPSEGHSAGPGEVTDECLTGRKVWWHQAIGQGQEGTALTNAEGPSGPQAQHGGCSSHPTGIFCDPRQASAVPPSPEQGMAMGRSNVDGLGKRKGLASHLSKGKKFSLALPPGLCTCSISFSFQDLNSDVTENQPGEQEPRAGVQEVSLEARLRAGRAPPSSLPVKNILPSSGPSSLPLLKTSESRGPAVAKKTQPRPPLGTTCLTPVILH